MSLEAVQSTNTQLKMFIFRMLSRRLLWVAGLRLLELLAIVVKVDAVAGVDGVVRAGYAHHGELEAGVLLELVILQPYLFDEACRPQCLRHR